MTMAGCRDGNLYRYYVDGFSGYAGSLDSLRNKLNNLLAAHPSLASCKVDIHRNQGETSVFEHTGPVDKTITL